MARRIESDDEVRRFTAVWLGPPGYSLPFHARYSAYLLGAMIFLAILLAEAITPMPVGVPPVWEICVTVLTTSVVMTAVDHDKPLGAVVRNAWQALTNPRPANDRDTFRGVAFTPRLKIHPKDPHEASSDR